MHVKLVQKTTRPGTKSDMELQHRPIEGAFKKLDRIGSHERIYIFIINAKIYFGTVNLFCTQFWSIIKNSVKMKYAIYVQP